MLTSQTTYRGQADRDYSRQFQKLDEVREHVLKEGHCSDEIDAKCSLKSYSCEPRDLNREQNTITLQRTSVKILFRGAMLGLHAANELSLVAVSGGYSPVVVCTLLIVVTSLIVEHRL